MNFEPFNQMDKRLDSSKDDSDLSYFYDLLLFGEYLTKIVCLYLVSAINEEKERTKYRQEFQLVRGNAIGDFARTIDEVLTGPPAQLLTSEIRDFEVKELTQRCSDGTWQYKAQTLLHETLTIFKIEQDPLPVKSPLRNWFQNFTYLRNKTKGHGATTSTPCSKACPILEESINLIINNFTAFKRPWVYLHRNYSGKYRISYVSDKTSDFDHLKSDPTFDFENGVYCFIDKPRRINLIYTNIELIDFYLPNGNLKNDKFECISYLTDDRQIVDAKDFLTPITKLPSSHTEGSRDLNIIGNSFTNLPVSSDEYVRRHALESELSKLLVENERFPVITLLGRGGIGKTSLALNVIREIAENKKKARFDLIIWFSARDIDLLIEGPKQVQTKVLNQKDIAIEYCNLVHPKVTIVDKVSFFSEQLRINKSGTALYIFDNFETITNPIEVFEWINTYIRNPNKVLITSRISRNFKGDYPVEIHGMDEEECKKLINIYTQKFEIEHLMTPTYIDELISESDGHPYIIKMLLGEVAKSKKIGKISRIVADQEQILTALFKRTFQTLSPSAKRVFLTLSSWKSLIPKIAVEAVLWRPENEKIDVQSAIEELVKSSFIELINEEENPLINVPLAAAIFGKSELEVFPEKIKIMDDRKLLMEFGAANGNSISVGLTPKIERKFSEVAKRINTLEEFKKELPTLQYLASKFPSAYINIVDILEEYSDYESMKYYLREYLKTVLPYPEKTRILQRLATICTLTSDWEGESWALSELVLIPKIEFEYISDACNRINNYYSNEPEIKNSELKTLLLTPVIEIMNKRIREGGATDYSRLAWLLLNNNEESRALQIAEKGLEIDPWNHHCRRIYSKLQ